MSTDEPITHLAVGQQIDGVDLHVLHDTESWGEHATVTVRAVFDSDPESYLLVDSVFGHEHDATLDQISCARST
jgi:hypothetical protein